MPTRTFQPCPNVIEITIIGQTDGQTVENKYYAQASATPTLDMVEELAAIGDTWAGTHMLPLCSAVYRYLRTVARDLTVEGSFEAESNAHTGIGADTGAPKPNNVTLAVHRKAVGSGKKQKSRIYWPSLFDAAFASTNEIDPTVGAAMETALDALRTAILAGTTGTFDYGFVSRVLDHAKRTNGLFVPVIAHSLVDLISDSMRSRLPGHGL